jgi:hypothetical protein
LSETPPTASVRTPSRVQWRYREETPVLTGDSEPLSHRRFQASPAEALHYNLTRKTCVHHFLCSFSPKRRTIDLLASP